MKDRINDQLTGYGSSPNSVRWTIIPCFLVALIVSPPGFSRESVPERPNIVFIMADDLGYGSLGCYDCEEVETPNVDALAETGVRLTDFHSNAPFCTPTRAAFLTGRYQQRAMFPPDGELSPVMQEQRRKNMKQRWAWGLSLDEITIAKVLKEAGYDTALVGKWHQGYDFRFHPMNYAFDTFRGHIGGGVNYHTHVCEHGLQELDWWTQKEIEDEPGYATDLLTKYAVDYIRQPREKPFFLYLAYNAPHSPYQGRDPTAELSKKEALIEMIEVLDEGVGKVVESIQESGLEENTLVIFCSDNGGVGRVGFPANGPLKGNKGNIQEGGIRVPFIARWPEIIPEGRVIDDTVMTMDMFPTFVRLAGASLPTRYELDGVDILPLLRGEGKLERRVLHWLNNSEWAVRKDRWKLIGDGSVVKKLVDLKSDLEEENDLSGSHPERVAELIGLHRAWVAQVGER